MFVHKKVGEYDVLEIEPKKGHPKYRIYCPNRILNHYELYSVNKEANIFGDNYINYILSWGASTNRDVVCIEALKTINRIR
jgi:hypothetical protein